MYQFKNNKTFQTLLVLLFIVLLVAILVSVKQSPRIEEDAPELLLEIEEPKSDLEQLTEEMLRLREERGYVPYTEGKLQEEGEIVEQLREERGYNPYTEAEIQEQQEEMLRLREERGYVPSIIE